MALGDPMASRLVHSSSASASLPNHHTNHVDGHLPVVENGPEPPRRDAADEEEQPAPVAYLPQVVVLCEHRHEGFDEAAAGPSTSGLVSEWRPKDRHGDSQLGASTSEPEGGDKPIVVRVKRKPSQTRPDALWLENNERPVKKAMLNFSSLSVSGHPLLLIKEPRVKKLLVQHIETIHHSEAVQDVLHSLLHSDLDAKEIKSKTKEWNNRTKQDKKQDQLRSAARQSHEDLGRNARFAQIWRSRKGHRNEVDESLQEICHLYDAIQVDSDEEKHPSEPRFTSYEEGAILCNFLPLIREHLPSAAEEIESDIISLAPSEDSDVYDIYTVKVVDDTTMEGTSSAPYPLLQVDDVDDVCYDDDDPYDTDDSNAEDNPFYDYPEELSEDEDGDTNSENPFSDIDGSDLEYKKEEVEEENDEDGR